MELGLPILFVGLLGLTAAITLLILGAVSLARGRRALGGSLLAAGVLLAAVPFFAFSALAESGKEHTVMVVGLKPATDPPFTVDIPHIVAHRGDEYYSFWDAGDQEDVLAAFQSQHPLGVRSDARTPDADNYPSLWHVSTDTMRYELVQDANPETFAVFTQVGYVTSADESITVRFPWPAAWNGQPPLSELTTWGSDWTADDWRAFYADIGQAKIDGDTITVPTSTDATVTLTLSGTDVTFVINP